MAERKGGMNPMDILEHPDEVAASEYWAIYECVQDALQDTPDEDKKAHALAMLDEFEKWAAALKERIKKL
jgi:hypothetical protein